PNAVICALEVNSKVHGHVNWTPATAVGRLTWMSLADDWDYNFHFFPDGDSGLTANNEHIVTDRGDKRYIELEFDSRETIDNFRTKWWTDLASAVRTGTDADVQRLLNASQPGAASQAIVYGLFGLDCEHACQSEFHPVYALGFETDDRASDNTWAMFV